MSRGVLASPGDSVGLHGIPTAPMVGAAGAELPLIKLFKAGVAQRFLGRAGKRWLLYRERTGRRAVLPRP